MRDGKNGANGWSLARFPSLGLRREFLDQIKVWNEVEGLPTIEVEPQVDGTGIRFRSSDENGIRRLIDCYGGYVKPPFLYRSHLDG